MILKTLAKKFILSKVNSAIEKINQKCDLESIKCKIQSVIDFCNSLLKKLEDNQISSEEADAILEEAKELF